MKRVLLDTSVYGRLVEDGEFSLTLYKYIPQDIVVYGNEIIRKELRAISKEARISGESKRKLLLRLYDSFVRKEKHVLKITKFVEILANEYFNEYKEAKGALSYKAMINDLKIIASASIHNLDIVISGDIKSMFSHSALKAYSKVNKKYQFRTPYFIEYSVFRNDIRGIIYDDWKQYQ